MFCVVLLKEKEKERELKPRRVIIGIFINICLYTGRRKKEWNKKKN